MTQDQTDNYAIKAGYTARMKNAYYDDDTGTTTWQPDVYTAVVELARKSGADTIIDIGSGNGQKLIPYKNEFKFIFVDFGPNLKIIEKNIGKRNNKFIDQDFEKGFPTFSDGVLQSSIVVCSDVLEHMRKPDILVRSLVDLSKSAPFVVISTPDRQRTRGVDHYGPPQNQTHVREWSMEELDTLFRAYGMKHLLTGITRSNDYEQVRRTIAIVAGTYLNDIAKVSLDNIDIHASYTDENTFAADYYYQQGVSLTKGTAQWGIALWDNEWLASPNPQIRIASLVRDARDKNYGFVEAQVIYVKPDKKYSWPEAGIIRQGHGLIGQVGKTRKLTILGDNKSDRIYPIKLIIFAKPPLKSRLTLGASNLVDTGHLADDFLLESLVGWNVLHN